MRHGQQLETSVRGKHCLKARGELSPPKWKCSSPPSSLARRLYSPYRLSRPSPTRGCPLPVIHRQKMTSRRSKACYPWVRRQRCRPRAGVHALARPRRSFSCPGHISMPHMAAPHFLSQRPPPSRRLVAQKGPSQNRSPFLLTPRMNHCSRPIQTLGQAEAARCTSPKVSRTPYYDRSPLLPRLADEGMPRRTARLMKRGSSPTPVLGGRNSLRHCKTSQTARSAEGGERRQSLTLVALLLALVHHLRHPARNLVALSDLFVGDGHRSVPARFPNSWPVPTLRRIGQQCRLKRSAVSTLRPRWRSGTSIPERPITPYSRFRR